jgi:hypothetical protein
VLTQARFNRNNAMYDHMTARANFDAAVLGRLPNAYSGAVSAGSDLTSSATGGTTIATMAGSSGGMGGSGSTGTSGGVSGSFNQGASGAGGF